MTRDDVQALMDLYGYIDSFYFPSSVTYGNAVRDLLEDLHAIIHGPAIYNWPCKGPILAMHAQNIARLILREEGSRDDRRIMLNILEKLSNA